MALVVVEDSQVIKAIMKCPRSDVVLYYTWRSPSHYFGVLLLLIVGSPFVLWRKGGHQGIRRGYFCGTTTHSQLKDQSTLFINT
jgi:hypothetical protein